MVRGIAINTLLGFGVTVTPATTSELVGVDGTRYSLESLLSKCQNEPDDVHWPRIAYDHFAALTEGAQRRPDQVDLADDIRVQVAPALSSSHRASNLLDARPIASDLDTSVPLAGLQLPHSEYPDVDLDEIELTDPEIAELWRAASANTAAEPIDNQSRLERRDVVIDVLEGESMYIASKIATMPHLIATSIGAAPYGVLLAIPNCHMLAFHRVTNASTALFTGYALADFSDHFFRHSSAPVTREIFFWYEGQMQQLTRTDDTGHTDLHIAGAFEQVYREMPHRSTR